MNGYDRSYLRKIRYAVQWGLFAFIAYSGYRLYVFSETLASGQIPSFERPALVDGFLPIGALMGFKLWLKEGIFDTVHPAAIVIFVAAISVSAVLKKGFCGWICPVGTLSELTFKAGKKAFGRNYSLPKYIDYPLRSLKYLLMGFFLYIVGRMSTTAISLFLGEPYWKVADLKMLRFFTNMTALTAIVLLGLFALSLPIKNFWCRYLCPYGALLGLLSFLSPFKITRNESACIHCHRCTKNCPQQLPVESKLRVKSPECTGCLTCLSVCPSKGAIEIAISRKFAIRPVVYIALIITVFFGIIWAGKLTGRWTSNVTYAQYIELIPKIGQLEHP